MPLTNADLYVMCACMCVCVHMSEYVCLSVPKLLSLKYRSLKQGSYQLLIGFVLFPFCELIYPVIDSPQMGVSSVSQGQS